MPSGVSRGPNLALMLNPSRAENVIRSLHSFKSRSSRRSRTALVCATTLFVGATTAFVGATTLFVGATTALVGAITLFVGATTALVGATTLFVGATTAFVGATTLFVGATTALVGAITLFVGATTALVGATTLLVGATTAFPWANTSACDTSNNPRMTKSFFMLVLVGFWLRQLNGPIEPGGGFGGGLRRAGVNPLRHVDGGMDVRRGDVRHRIQSVPVKHHVASARDGRDLDDLMRLTQGRVGFREDAQARHGRAGGGREQDG